MTAGDRLKGRVALITGAAQGIGRAIALKMGREGASLALMDINEKVIELARQMEGESVPASAFKVDVGEEQGVEDAVKDVLRPREPGVLRQTVDHRPKTVVLVAGIEPENAFGGEKTRERLHR